MYEIYTGAPDDEQAKISYLMQLFNSARNHRLNFETQWEESAALVWPEYRNSFYFGHVRAPGVKYTQYSVDSSLAIKAWRFMAIADALLTPNNMMWSQYQATDRELMKDRDAKVYYEKVSQTIWNYRYRPSSNFLSQNQTNWHSLGVFGNLGMYVEEYDAAPLSRDPGLSYTTCSPGEIYILVNRQGRVDAYIRHFRWNARQARQKWGDKIPPTLGAALDKADVFTLFDFLEFVIPRTDYDPLMIFSRQGRPWSSTYVSVVGYSIIEEGPGYWSFPLPHGRYMVAPEEWYGRGPTQQILPEAKTKNTAKEAYMKQAKLAGDPTYLLPEDGMFDFKAESGAYNYGGMTEDGKMLVGILPTGQIQITKEFMADTDKNLDAAYLNDLFPLLFNQNGSQKSPAEMMDVLVTRGMILAPTLGRQYGEYLMNMGIREYDLLNRMRLLPPPPPVVKEARAKMHIKWCSPLALALEAQGIAGFMRSVQMTTEIANSSQDDTVWDIYDFDTAIPEMASNMHAPARWMASPQQMASKRKARQAAQQREDYVRALPGLAARDKAQAIVAKANTGGNIGGTLSGTPQGGMPTVPGNPPGQPGQPGTFGMPGRVGQAA